MHKLDFQTFQAFTQEWRLSKKISDILQRKYYFYQIKFNSSMKHVFWVETNLNPMGRAKSIKFQKSKILSNCKPPSQILSFKNQQFFLSKPGWMSKNLEGLLIGQYEKRWVIFA